MLFTTRVFAVFLLVVLPVYYALPAKWRLNWLLAASWLFYLWGDPAAVPLVAATIVVGWACARRADVADARVRRRWTAVALGWSLGALLWFKYWNFLLDSAEAGAGALGMRLDLALLHTTTWLPIGISFYTFQIVSYVLDVHRGATRAEPSLRNFALYVMFFPQLVAGPVERAVHLLPQIELPFRLTRAQVRDGVFLILLGVVKKAVIADRLAEFVAPNFAEPVESTAIAWAGVLLFTTDIYCDFSAYSDIAIGLGKLLGYDIRPNFDLPFVVPSIVERWRRWHISMGTFFRDYVYIPLGGSRGGFWRTQLNLMIVMFLSGLWHGASANFVVWGLLNGLAMVGHALLRPVLDPVAAVMAPRALTRWGWYYLCATVTMGMIASINIFFRSDTWAVANSYVRAMFLAPLAGEIGAVWLPETYRTGLAWMAVVLVAHEVERHLGVRARVVAQPIAWAVTCLALLALIVLYATSGTRRFIYFQF